MVHGGENGKKHMWYSISAPFYTVAFALLSSIFMVYSSPISVSHYMTYLPETAFYECIRIYLTSY